MNSDIILNKLQFMNVLARKLSATHAVSHTENIGVFRLKNLYLGDKVKNIKQIFQSSGGLIYMPSKCFEEVLKISCLKNIN